MPDTALTYRATAAFPDGAAARRALRRYRVELRKLLDTPSGLSVFCLTIAAAVLAVPLILLTGPVGSFDAADLAANALGLVAYILPLLAILTITGEWRLRTVLTTYTLDSARTAVLAAKGAALLTVVPVVVSVALAAGSLTALVVGAPVPGPWALLARAVGMLAGMAGIALVGIGVGASLLNTPLAIIVYLTLPPMLPQLLSVIPSLAPAAPYLNIHAPLLGILNGQAPQDVPAFLVAAVVWIAAPLAVGLLRNARKDIS